MKTTPNTVNLNKAKANIQPRAPDVSQRAMKKSSLLQKSKVKVKNSLDTLSRILNERQHRIEDDECDLYGRLLAKKLRKFNDVDREEVMYEIDTLVRERTYTRAAEASSPSSNVDSEDTVYLWDSPSSSPSLSPLPPNDPSPEEEVVIMSKEVKSCSPRSLRSQIWLSEHDYSQNCFTFDEQIAEDASEEYMSGESD